MPANLCVMLFHQDLIFHPFSGSICFPFLPVLYLAVSPLAGILSKLIWNLHPSFFYYTAFSIFLFPTNLPNGSSCFGFSKEPARWGLRKTMLPTTRVCHPLSICGLRTGTCWSINIHICLAAVSWSLSPTATCTRTVVSQDWLSRGVLL